MNPGRLQIQGDHKIKVTLKIMLKVSKKLIPLILWKIKKVMISICSHYDKYGHVDSKCWKLHQELCPYKKKNKEKTNAMIQKYEDIKDSSDVDEKINCSAIKKVEEYQDIEK